MNNTIEIGDCSSKYTCIGEARTPRGRTVYIVHRQEGHIDLKICGRYRNVKTHREYQVLGRGTDLETGEEFVVYMEGVSCGRLWIQQWDKFFQPTKVNGSTTTLFGKMF